MKQGRGAPFVCLLFDYCLPGIVLIRVNPWLKTHSTRMPSQGCGDFRLSASFRQQRGLDVRDQVGFGHLGLLHGLEILDLPDPLVEFV